MMSRTILPNFLRDFLSETTFSLSEKETNTFSSCCSCNNLATIRASFQFRNHHEKTFVDNVTLSSCKIRSDQIRSVTQSCPNLCNPMNRSTPGLPVHHQLPEFTKTHVHRVSDAIQPSHPLSSPSPPAPNSYQHQGLFQ